MPDNEKEITKEVISEEIKEDEAAKENAEEETEETAEETVTVEETTKEEETETQEETKESEKVFFGKKTRKKIEELEEKVASLTDSYKRLMAEFDNYRKRTEKEKSSMFDLGTVGTLEKILPVVDNFERGLAAIPEAERENPLYTGMDMIYKQFVKTLEDMGVKPMDAVGKEFDPNLHNAVMQVESEELEDNIIAAELQKGYLYKDHVLRHAMVSVVKK